MRRPANTAPCDWCSIWTSHRCCRAGGPVPIEKEFDSGWTLLAAVLGGNGRAEPDAGPDQLELRCLTSLARNRVDHPNVDRWNLDSQFRKALAHVLHHGCPARLRRCGAREHHQHVETCLIMDNLVLPNVAPRGEGAVEMDGMDGDVSALRSGEVEHVLTPTLHCADQRERPP